MWKRQDNDTQNARRNDELRKAQFDATARQNIGWVGGAGHLTGTGTREAPKGDCDTVFKAALGAAPCNPLYKSEAPTIRASDREVADNPVEQNARALNLIRKAHANGANWNPFAPVQDSPVAKLNGYVGLGEVGEIDLARGEIRISKAH